MLLNRGKLSENGFHDDQSRLTLVDTAGFHWNLWISMWDGDLFFFFFMTLAEGSYNSVLILSLPIRITKTDVLWSLTVWPAVINLRPDHVLVTSGSGTNSSSQVFLFCIPPCGLSFSIMTLNGILLCFSYSVCSFVFQVQLTPEVEQPIHLCWLRTEGAFSL